MIAVLTPEQMKLADAAALSSAGEHRESVFIERADYAVAHVARKKMGGSYGKQFLVTVGKGHNGDDGRAAAQWLQQRGAVTTLMNADDAGGQFIDSRCADLVIDAAYGIGFHGSWTPPFVSDVPVLAVDIPSGVNALDGSVNSSVLVANRTVTFGAPKTGMLLGDGPSFCGEIDLVDLGIDPLDDDTAFLVEATDVAAWLPPRDRVSHKWNNAVRVIAGSAGMGDASCNVPTEVVGKVLPAENWGAYIGQDVQRFQSLVIEPGLGRGDDVGVQLRSVLACDLPMVIDGDGISGSIDPHGDYSTLRSRAAATILTPHDGEFASLGGDAQSSDRIGATRDLAARIGCTIVRKGPTTIISSPDGRVYLVASGDERLATAGTGDVLAGIIGALLARGLAAPEAAAAAACVHGVAGSRCATEGTIARDVVGLISDVLSDVMSHVN